MVYKPDTAPGMPEPATSTNDAWPTFVLTTEKRKDITQNGLRPVALHVTGPIAPLPTTTLQNQNTYMSNLSPQNPPTISISPLSLPYGVPQRTSNNTASSVNNNTTTNWQTTLTNGAGTTGTKSGVIMPTNTISINSSATTNFETPQRTSGKNIYAVPTTSNPIRTSGGTVAGGGQVQVVASAPVRTSSAPIRHSDTHAPAMIALVCVCLAFVMLMSSFVVAISGVGVLLLAALAFGFSIVVVKKMPRDKTGWDRRVASISQWGAAIIGIVELARLLLHF